MIERFRDRRPACGLGDAHLNFPTCVNRALLTPSHRARFARDATLPDLSTRRHSRARSLASGRQAARVAPDGGGLGKKSREPFLFQEQLASNYLKPFGLCDEQHDGSNSDG